MLHICLVKVCKLNLPDIIEIWFFKKVKIIFWISHSRLTYDNLARFAFYAYSLSSKYNAYVSLYVVCGHEIRNPISSYENNSFNVNIFSLNNYGGDEILDSISNKVIHSEKLNENDLNDLMFLPLMSSKNSIYIFSLKNA